MTTLVAIGSPKIETLIMLLACFTFGVYLFGSAMKLMSFRKTRGERPPIVLFFLSPVASTVSFRKARPATAKNAFRVFLLIAFFGSLWIFSWFLYFHWTKQNPGMSMWILSYCALLPLYFMGQTASLFLELIWMPSGLQFPMHHRFPLVARSLSDFWGNRWNTWVSDWVRQMIFRPMSKTPVRGLFAGFFLSGMVHEIIINVPLYFLYGVNLLGSMMIFFPLQAVGILIERKLAPGSPLLKRACLYLFVVAPAPLIFNEAILRMFHLYR
jgi:hypothetical protein